MGDVAGDAATEGAGDGATVAVGSGVCSALGSAVASTAGTAELVCAELSTEAALFAASLDELPSFDLGANAKNNPVATRAAMIAPMTRVVVLGLVPFKRAM